MNEIKAPEAPKPEIRDLSSIDMVLLENLALFEENVALKHQLNESRVREKKLQLQHHLAQRFNIDTGKFEFSADTKHKKLVITPKKNAV